MTELFNYQQKGLSLQQAIQLPLTEETYGLFYTPKQCLFGRLDGDTIRDSQDKEVNLKQIYEARIFNPSVELRWLKSLSTDGLGSAVYLFEKPAETKKNWEQLPTLNDLSNHENHYLLWGEHWQTENLAENWSCLATSRIGKLLVPIANLEKQRVVLKTREYFGLPRNADGKLTLAGEHGNKVVVEERWLSLETCN